MTDAVDTPLTTYPELPAGVLCPECAYALRGLTGDRCPECGYDLTAVRSPHTQLPWTQRGDRGFWSAYWGTVRVVGTRAGHVAVEMVRPVDYRQALRFRWVTTLLAYLPPGGLALLALFWLLFVVPPDDRQRADHLWLFGGALLVVTGFLIAVPALLTYLFYDRRSDPAREGRAIALGYYASGPLAYGVWVFVPLVSAYLSMAPLPLTMWWSVLLVALAVWLCRRPRNGDDWGTVIGRQAAPLTLIAFSLLVTAAFNLAADWYRQPWSAEIALLAAGAVYYVSCYALAFFRCLTIARRIHGRFPGRQLLVVGCSTAGLLVILLSVPLGVFYLLIMYHSLQDLPAVAG